MTCAALVIFVGCNKNTDNGAPISSRSTSRGGGISTTGAFTNPNTGAGTSSNVGIITSSAGSNQVFSEAIQFLLSAGMNMSDVGFISKGGVRFAGRIALDSNGNLVAGRNSRMEIEVRDDKANAGAAPIYIKIPATQAQYDFNSQYQTVVFEDDQGSITLRGQYYQGQWNGSLAFRNFGNGNHSGENLEIQINYCGFFVCNQ